MAIDNPTSLPFRVRDAGGVLKGNVGHYLCIWPISICADGARPGIPGTPRSAPYPGADAMAETQESMRDQHGALWPAQGAEPDPGAQAVRRAHHDRASGLPRPPATTVADLLAWYRALPPAGQAEVRAGMAHDKEQQRLAKWRAHAALRAA